MLLTNTGQVVPVKLVQAPANPLFPALDGALRLSRHIGLDELDNHAFLMDLQEYFERFYSHYNVELIRMPKRFFYLRPYSTTPVPRSVLFELDMVVGKILCCLHSSPERLANEGILIQQELYDELLTLADEVKLLKLMDNRSTGSGVDRQELQGKVCSSSNHLRRLGTVWSLGHSSSKLRITRSVFHFDANVCSGDDPHGTQRRLIRDGEAMAVENRLQLNDEPGEDQPGSGEEE